ncbi:arsenate reductase ArsC [Desulfoferula mesophila]|uniref:Protein-tyrosine-phosphatase n=1 Tax=Desulfoferula mesophila TaxID=3058419 RepID=A0AAU9EB11_9BACT|nr:protein-tyrosine-phosphatase [Desulfoferula mesophilus]
MSKDKVLFLCAHGNARGPMAEAFLNEMAGDRFEAQSAGLEPAAIDPLAAAVMDEIGLDIRREQTHNVFDLYRQGHLYAYVITLCTESEKRCPMFPGITHRLHWPVGDPADLPGSPEEQKAAARHIRDQIKKDVQGFLAEHS